MTKLAGANTTVHLKRTPSQVLDYLETTLAPKLAGDLDIDRQELTGKAMLFPGSVVQQNPGGTQTVHFTGNNAVAWILGFQCSGVGNGTNVMIWLSQFNDNLLQRKLARRQLESFVGEIAASLYADLGD